ncbi:hypothetical protein DENSPDRAFT_839276 [Dentipellis sp. KUC8613]|nr:hypothetical protein DENSPDRAFT_839276 [Dentipellis sp. KUC8613]
MYGCGHYVVTKKLRKVDCGNRYCYYSSKHPDHCPNCYCDKFLGPDVSENITMRTPDYCNDCHYWYRGAGKR